jgi:hypothetical protein
MKKTGRKSTNIIDKRHFSYHRKLAKELDYIAQVNAEAKRTYRKNAKKKKK